MNGMTSISAGVLLGNYLADCEDVTRMATNIYPVDAPSDQPLPYVSFKRVAAQNIPVKSHNGYDVTNYDIYCYGAKYDDAVSLAEAVRHNLDGMDIAYPAVKDRVLTAKCITLTDAEEAKVGDAFVVRLSFTMKVY